MISPKDKAEAEDKPARDLARRFIALWQQQQKLADADASTKRDPHDP